MCKKLIKNSQPFGKKFQKTVGGGDFFWLTLYIVSIVKILASSRGFRGQAIELGQTNSTMTDPCWHDNKIWYKIGYMSTCIGDISEILPSNRVVGVGLIECCLLNSITTWKNSDNKTSNICDKKICRFNTSVTMTLVLCVSTIFVVDYFSYNTRITFQPCMWGNKPVFTYQLIMLWFNAVGCAI